MARKPGRPPIDDETGPWATPPAPHPPNRLSKPSPKVPAASPPKAGGPEDAVTPVDVDHGADENWTGDDLEAAYQRALAALEAVDSEAVAIADELSPSSPADSASLVAPSTESPATGTIGPTSGLTATAAVAAAEAGAPPDPVRSEPVPTVIDLPQVIEACLFVGGATLTATRLAALLRGDYTAQQVEAVIEGLNRQYTAEGRPYTIQLGEGGYRLALHEDYERLRQKVFGMGPKEVRLSQDVLEILAVVAYRQPLSEEELGELGRPQAGGTLRQLLRRDLIAVDRDPKQPKLVRYRTTARFLQVFGLRSLEDLPRPDDLPFK